MNRRMPLTIALVLGTAGTSWGGMEKHTEELAAGLASLGHSVHVIAHPDYRPEFTTTIHFHPFPVQLGRRNPWGWWQMGKRLRDIGPDIIHAQGNKAANLIQHCGPAGTVKLATVHGTKSSYGAFRNLDGVIVVNRKTAQEIPNHACRVIYNGVRAANSEQMPSLRIPDNQAFAMAAGRLEPVKQYDRLIEAWSQTRTDLPLYILGEGSQRQCLENKVAELGLSGKVFLPGYEPNIQPWLRAASLCIISSSREGFPYILIESLLNRCPVLSTPVNGALEFLPADCLAQATSTASISALLASHFNDPSQTLRSEQPVFERASKELTVERMVASTENFYHELHDQRSAR